MGLLNELDYFLPVLFLKWSLKHIPSFFLGLNFLIYKSKEVGLNDP